MKEEGNKGGLFFLHLYIRHVICKVKLKFTQIQHVSIDKDLFRSLRIFLDSSFHIGYSIWVFFIIFLCGQYITQLKDDFYIVPEIIRYYQWEGNLRYKVNKITGKGNVSLDPTEEGIFIEHDR